MTQSIPLYQQIKQHILVRIESGEYPLHQQIPPEQELAGQFKVSRMTAHKAIRDLVQEGYLMRRAGLGTFVTEPKAESPLADISNIADEVRSRGHEYSNSVIVLEAMRANEEVALHMGMRLNSRVFHSVMVHKENGAPIQVEERFVHPTLAPGYLQCDFGQQTPNAYLVEHCPLSDLEHIVEARMAPANIGDWLQISPDSPCLLVTRRTWSLHQLVSFARLWHPGDKYKLRSTLKLG
ncbi:histidine utilization repressor [Oceanisphaera arctica]|uniref:Histidine utilization repressor n=1 Tax=Oceanisphaera arctica TaxID=641510 RepID=A0A2P5TM49_9GAMM|nr:histidine utilization repressor [Oceanisphaera arctica]PPL16453.1 histidine utilization repressor [Oceanisphaera arctica]GHA03705.1 histidine utilization repressor [Oceanisphaera arctica]